MSDNLVYKLENNQEKLRCLLNCNVDKYTTITVYTIIDDFKISENPYLLYNLHNLTMELSL